MTTTTPQKLRPWTDAENAVLAHHYVEMLAQEWRGDKYNKAAHRRLGLAEMSDTRTDDAMRSHGSWEMKCCNASAVLHSVGLRFIKGYKPLGRGQMKPLARALADEFDREGDALSMAAADKLREVAA